MLWAGQPSAGGEANCQGADKRYRLSLMRLISLMRLRIPSLRAVAATAISLWMAVLACFMGCALPALANSASRGSSVPLAVTSSISQSAPEQNTAEQGQADPMAGMENCPHHSTGKVPGKPGDGKSAPGRMSCCPLEITVAPRPDSPAAAIAPAQGFVLASGLPLRTVSFSSSLEVVPSVYHSGRDTLRKIGLLRI